MVGNRSENNSASVSGVIIDEPVFSHEVYGEGFYCFNIKVRRLSESYDTIPVTVSERLTDLSEYRIGRTVVVDGQFRSYNAAVPGSSVRLLLTVFAREVSFPEESLESDQNSVELNGFICKPPVYRTTPFNREIADFLLAVNRGYNKSDYIPCICWGRNARFCGKRTVGDQVRVSGRMQSRVYQKKFPDGTVQEKTVYEVSVAKIEFIRKDEEASGGTERARVGSTDARNQGT